MTKRRVGAVLIAIVGFGLLPGIAEAAPARSAVVIYQHNDADGTWGGMVGSVRSSCIANRKVTVYRKKSGKDAKIGSGKSNQESGSWTVADSDPDNGTYYAKVKAVKNKCKAATSNKVDYPSGMAAQTPLRR